VTDTPDSSPALHTDDPVRHRQYDVELFIALNAEYEHKRLVPNPRGMAHSELTDQAARRASSISKRVDLHGCVSSRSAPGGATSVGNSSTASAPSTSV